MHAEYDAAAPHPFISLSWCPVDIEGGTRLQGKLRVTIARDSLAFRILGVTRIEEEYHCNYELNPEYQPLFEGSGLRITGTGESGEARVVELAGAPFFLATLFQPQRRPKAEGPHPLITAFLAAALGN
ncbi:MAG TPA: hypothetical protein VEZ14_09555 [Dehalococcoidia bacterium]|nr:hypothetical protein [Dehalococcoidia bacterium]